MTFCRACSVLLFPRNKSGTTHLRLRLARVAPHSPTGLGAAGLSLGYNPGRNTKASNQGIQTRMLFAMPRIKLNVARPQPLQK